MRNIILTLMLMAVLSSGCFVHRVTIGDGPEGREKDHGVPIHSKDKQIYFLWGLIGFDKAEVEVPKDLTDYQYKMSQNFWDGLVMSLTAGIVGLRTVKVYAADDATSINDTDSVVE
jgi:hypothetical protein